MNDSTPPPPSRSLPCQRDPERWFDRRTRGNALEHCLTCAARPWCAREALKCHATWGVWAGVWIDGRHRDAAPYLQAIAADTPAPTAQRPPALAASTLNHPQQVPAPLHRPPTPPPSGSSRTAVLARSCGHCEVFTENCRYTCDRLMSRYLIQPVSENPSPAALFAACTVCAEIVAGLDAHLATRLGYTVASGRDPASVPFHWRGSRWVLLDRDGWLTEIRDAAQSA